MSDVAFPEAASPPPPTPVKKNHAPRGKSIAIGLIALVFGSIATVAIHESVAGNGDRLSAKLGVSLNQAMIVTSKFGMGLSELYDDFAKAPARTPEGMIAVTEAPPASGLRPSGVSLKSEPATFVGKQCRELHRASHNAFISAKKVEIYSAK